MVFLEVMERMIGQFSVLTISTFGAFICVCFLSVRYSGSTKELAKILFRKKNRTGFSPLRNIIFYIITIAIIAISPFYINATWLLGIVAGIVLGIQAVFKNARIDILLEENL